MINQNNSRVLWHKHIKLGDDLNFINGPVNNRTKFIQKFVKNKKKQKLSSFL